LHDVDYLEKIITYVVYAPCHNHPVFTCISIAKALHPEHLALHSWAHMHHTGSQENEVGPKEQQETQEQELSGGPELERELQECPDHRPSTFEKDKPRSILSLPILTNLINILWLFYYAAFK
jgi:hypothetical protein